MGEYDKKTSIGDASYWLERHRNDLDRFLYKEFSEKDNGVIREIFKEYPGEARIILKDYKANNLQKQNEILKELALGKSKISYIIGMRGGGKTALAMWLVDKLHEVSDKRGYYVVGEGVNKSLFPKWIRFEDDLKNVPVNSFAVVDETAIRYSARETWKKENIVLGKMLSIARHNSINVIFITVNAYMVDINISRMRDCVFWKRSNDYGIHERGLSQDTHMYQKLRIIRMNMAPEAIEDTLFEYPGKRRFIKFNHGLADFWSDKMSVLFRGYDFKAKEEDKIREIVKPLPFKTIQEIRKERLKNSESGII